MPSDVRLWRGERSGLDTGSECFPGLKSLCGAAPRLVRRCPNGVPDNARTVMYWRWRVAVGVGACVAAAALGGCGGTSSRRSNAIKCVPASQPRYFPNRGDIRLSVGASLVLALGESESYMSSGRPGEARPPGALFPWATPASSNRKVLQSVPLCPETRVYSLPVELAAFKAVHAGEATVTAPLVRAWQAVSPRQRRGLHAEKVTVIVSSSS